jgi:hypothetical protein
LADAAVRLWIGNLKDDQAGEVLKSEWNKIYRKVKEDSETRNQLAHFRLFPNENDDGTTTWFVCPYFQVFSHLSSLRGNPDKLKVPDNVRKFDAKSMQAKLSRFASTGKRVDRFIGGLCAHGAQLPK